MLSVALVSHGHERFFQDLLQTLFQFLHLEVQIVVVDNKGNGAFFEAEMKRVGHADYIVHANSASRSFSRNYNFAVQLCRHENVLVLNPDIKFRDGSVDRYIKEIEEIPNGLYFPALLNFDGSPQKHGKRMPNFYKQCVAVLRAICGGNALATAEGNDWFFAAALFVKRSFFIEIGGFCELFPMYCEDVEICDRVRKMGYPVVRLDDVTVLHRLGGDSKGRYILRAIVSNILLRLVTCKNTIIYRSLRRS